MLRNYLKLAWKVLLRRKFFTLVSLFGISFTLLVLLVASSLLDHMFAPHPPENELSRMLGVYTINLSGPQAETSGFPGYGFLDRYVRDLPSAERVSIFQLQHPVDSFAENRKLNVYFKRTDGSYWQILDFEFLEGGPISMQDAQSGSPVAVINESTRDQLFGGEPAVGRSLLVEDQTYRVIGVVRDIPFYRFIAFADVWVPIRTLPSSGYQREFLGDFLGVILAPSRSEFSQIRSELLGRLSTAEPPDPREYDTVFASADSLFDFVARLVLDVWEGESPAPQLWVALVVLSLLFMVLPALNLVNINLSRILERSSEIGIRKSFGASSRTLVVQFIVENLVLTLLGGAISLILAAVVLAIINDSGLIPYAHLSLNFRIFAYSLVFVVALGFLSGVYPAWRMARMNPVDALHRRPT